MKIKLGLRKKSFSLFSVFCLLTVLIFPILAQQKKADSVQNKLLSPAEQEFQKATDLISPWRDSGCNYPRLVQEPGCYEVPPTKWKGAHLMTLYNEDGSLWYQFSVNYDDPNFYRKNTKMGFMPFATYTYTKGGIILRMTGESPNWYEVEVNEETQKTKFVLKSDPMWAKSTWNHWLVKMESFTPRDSDNLLLDKPEGNIVEGTAQMKFEDYIFLKADGDWVYVEAAQYSGLNRGFVYKGWIRFRKDQDLLIKSNSFLEFKVIGID